MTVRGRRPEPDPEEQRRSAHADELLLAVAARLLGEARLVGSFPTGERAPADFAAELSTELAADEHVFADPDERLDLPRGDYKVTLSEARPDEIRLNCWYGSRGRHASLRIDGILEDRAGSFGVRLDDECRRVELSPTERQVMELALARRSELDPADLRGEEFLRALPIEPQPGAAAQLLAVELYGDGLVVHYTYDDPTRVRPAIPLEFYDLAGVEAPIEELRAEAEAEGGNLAPHVSVADDLGTEYVGGSAGEGGVEVVHGEARFTPAVPADATRLIVASYAGTVELRL